jgi:ribose transport system permease protein
MKEFRFWFAEQRGTLLALAIFVAMFAIYVLNHPAVLNNGFNTTSVGNVVQTAANKGVLLALVAMAQTFVVLTAGIDLSVGAVFILANCLASYIVVGSPLTVTAGVIGVLLAGAVCGAVNALIVIFGRLQPIVATIASGAVFFGIALWMRPFPGSSPDFAAGLASALTGKLFGVIPTSLVFLAAVVIVVWIPFRRSVLGRAVYASGSSEVAAYMSGMPVKRAKFVAYVLSGIFAALAGLFLTFFTYSGEASAANGNTYTLYSIAAVVLGGVSLFGGRGSAIGAIFGALAFRAIGDLLFVFEVDPLWQPLFQGIVLLLAVSIGSARLFRVRNRLELFG